VTGKEGELSQTMSSRRWQPTLPVNYIGLPNHYSPVEL